MCCGRGGSRTPVARYVSYGQNRAGAVRAATLSDMAAMADAPPVVVDENVILRWARIPLIARIIPQMNEVRRLEVKIHANSCRSCTVKKESIDKSIIEIVKMIIAELPENLLLQLKQAAGIVKLKVAFRDSSGHITEVIR